MNLKVGDKVVVIAGSSKGKEGKILRTLKKEYKFQNYINGLLESEEVKKYDTNKTPKELLKEINYTLIECNTEEEIQRFRKYYEKDELLCSFFGGMVTATKV